MSSELQNEPIIIFTMGKVGSISIYESLLALQLSRPIYHTHNLTEDDIAKLQAAVDEGVDVARLSKKIAEIKQLRQVVYANDRRRRKVITLVRDPIAWSISALFQSIERKFPDLDFEDDLSINLKKVQEIFEQKQENYYELASTWFDAKFKSVFDIDVFSMSFPWEKGYHIYPGERADLLLIRLESLNRCYHQAFKEFLNIELLKLPYLNVASDKAYHSLYHAFVKSVSLSPPFIDKMYAMPYVQHFYSYEEIDWFRLKWTYPRIRQQIESIRAEAEQNYKSRAEYWIAEVKHWKTEAKVWKTEAKVSTIGRIKRRIQQSAASVFESNKQASTEQIFRD